MIVRSCNVGLGTVALALGPNRLYDGVRKLGFGARTGIELAGETPGLLMPAKTWSLVQTANIGFGQGVSVTPIQLLSGYCTIANGGFRVKPHVVKMISSEGKMEALSLPEPERVLSESTCSYMKSALQGVVEEPHGTGSVARIPRRTVGGKTGTAQKPTPEAGYHSGKYVGSFVGFAPVNDPRLAVIVVIDEPQGSHYGGVVAAPAFKQIMQTGLSYLHVPPDADPGATGTKPGGSAAE
jgi:cell division protein FtsI/penicillin-binding protein 2